MRNLYLSLLFLFIISATVSAQTDIKRIDFKNFTFEPFCASEQASKVTVKNGEFYEEKQMDGFTDRFFYKVFDVAYGDLDGDRKDEAVVLSYCNTGGTGNFSEGFVYGMKNGKPVLLARIEGGDRAYGGLREARIENGTLVVERNDPGENGGSCCPEFVVTTKYKLNGKKLIENGASDRRELYPKQRVTFAKGASGTTFKIAIPGGEIKRFVVGARAGQTLTASVGSDKSSIRLLEDADVKEGVNNFTARLPKNGDYTIEVQSLAETDLEITVNIKIR
ncbi:MAG TPA: hypothetical protein VF556_11835 [Pyrinomonadaceae bacterium]|jgi:hypothetical protein